jgi:hypothetical protein
LSSKGEIKMAISIIPIILIILIILAGITGLTKARGIPGFKLMLLGINITLFGGIIAVDPNSDLGGIEYLIAFVGLIISVTGLIKND